MTLITLLIITVVVTCPRHTLSIIILTFYVNACKEKVMCTLQSNTSFVHALSDPVAVYRRI